MLLSRIELSYVAIQLASASTNLESSMPWDVELNQDPCLSLSTQLDPLSSSFDESHSTSNHVSKWKKKRSQWRKQKQMKKPLAFGDHFGGMSPASGHHVGDKELSSISHDGSSHQPLGIMLERTTQQMVIMWELAFFVRILC